jgi:hypothetical protein
MHGYDVVIIVKIYGGPRKETMTVPAIRSGRSDFET